MQIILSNFVKSWIVCLAGPTFSTQYKIDFV